VLFGARRRFSALLMPTKRFTWKNRDTAAQDLIQLTYHAPQFISQHALNILSAIRSEVIASDLRAITLDSDRAYWERVYALRALGNTTGDFAFPELWPIAKQDLVNRQHIVSRSGIELDRADEIYFPPDMIGEIIGFTARHPRNKDWLLDLLDRADPLAVCILLTKQLSVAPPEEMSVLILHRLVALLETYPTLLNLYSVHQIYHYGHGDGKTQTYLNSYFGAIVEKSISASLVKHRRDELPWTIPFEWPELKAAVLHLRPDLEEKLRRDETRRTAEQTKHKQKYREDFSYKETAIWRELEDLYERATKEDNRAYWKLYHKTYDDALSIPARAAATRFFGKLRDRPGAIEKLSLLARWPSDIWESYYSPVRFEASQALFELATPEAWEALIAAFLGSQTDMLQSFLWDWIESLTDKLSGVTTVSSRIDGGIANRWFNALVKDPQA
jgi:hypothetical protein